MCSREYRAEPLSAWPFPLHDLTEKPGGRPKRFQRFYFFFEQFTSPPFKMKSPPFGEPFGIDRYI